MENFTTNSKPVLEDSEKLTLEQLINKGKHLLEKANADRKKHLENLFGIELDFDPDTIFASTDVYNWFLDNKITSIFDIPITESKYTPQGCLIITVRPTFFDITNLVPEINTGLRIVRILEEV